MVRISRTVLAFTVAAVAVAATDAQEPDWAERAYRSAVARYFHIPEAEIAILANWDLPAQEIPVVLFIAQRAGVSAEALVALRESGWSWTDLAQRYRVGPHALHVPLRDPESAGALAPLYDRFRDTPVADWSNIELGESDIVALVNVRVLSASLGLLPEEITRRTGTTQGFVELYAQLIR